ncbi:hypothetical protein GOP47_0016104 [Adiantum capillus-veneris]|uniref:DOG1 domain-containing protein n=1 Tax=Adiantum capillus-veneris TaxID=13818 RepID=A0A9D4ZE77_ADICA|nr:hypothetical protein GOP47_0015702 [Adiantum capillus-veneris]KAI5069803.1 hypothetical protein GOP47_0016104 [Adiantum capillus-veneris]
MAAAPHRWELSETWIEWKAHTESLRTALAAHHDHLYSSAASASCASTASTAHSAGDGGHDKTSAAAASKAHITELLRRCLDLYKESLHLNSNDSALSSMAGHQHSPLEVAFLWLGGWRPTSAITLIYSTLGLHESQRTLFDHTPLLGACLNQQELLLSINAALLDNRLSSSHTLPNCISDCELVAVESLRRKTLDIELYLSHELASFQMLLLDHAMLEAFTRDMNVGRGSELVEVKVSQLTHLLAEANQLRMDTLERLVDVLDPVNSALCCVSAFELINALKSLN